RARRYTRRSRDREARHDHLDFERTELGRIRPKNPNSPCQQKWLGTERLEDKRQASKPTYLFFLFLSILDKRLEYPSVTCQSARANGHGMPAVAKDRSRRSSTAGGGKVASGRPSRRRRRRTRTGRCAGPPASARFRSPGAWDHI